MKLLQLLIVLGVSSLASLSSYAETQVKATITPKKKAVHQEVKTSSTSAKKAVVVKKKQAQAKKKKAQIATAVPVSSAAAATVASTAAATTKTALTQEQKLAALKQFIDSVGITYTEFKIVKDNGQDIVNFFYTVENKSQKFIDKVHWVTAYYYNDQRILTHNMLVNFNGKLAAGQQISFSYPFPWQNMDKQAQEILSNPQSELVTNFSAKSIEFVDGSKIELE